MDEVLGGDAPTDKGGNEARRIILVLTVMVAALVLGSGMALGAVKFGTGGSAFLVGTKGEDVLYARCGNVIGYGKGVEYVF
jgi:hypothetical protein